jgi:hypothetical protein
MVAYAPTMSATKLYGEDREITLRDLPILGRRTYIRLRPKRYEYPYCEGNPRVSTHEVCTCRLYQI